MKTKAQYIKSARTGRISYGRIVSDGIPDNWVVHIRASAAGVRYRATILEKE